MVGIRFYRVGFSFDVWAAEKIITGISYSIFHTGYDKTNVESFRTVSRGFCYTCGTRNVGKYNNNCTAFDICDTYYL